MDEPVQNSAISLTGDLSADIATIEAELFTMRESYLKKYGSMAYSASHLNKLEPIPATHGRSHRRQLKEAHDIEDMKATLALMRRKRPTSTIMTESGEASDGAITTEEKHGLFVDVVGDEDKHEVLEEDKDMTNIIKDNFYLNEFFERPVQIFETELALSTLTPNYALRVWSLYTLDPTVRSKLRNFSLFRGNLNLRIAVSGTPFHAGRLLLSYQPYPDRNQNIAEHEAAEAINPNWASMFNNYLSQAEGAVTLNVNENKPVHMKCPFISVKDMHRLYNASALALASTTPYEDFEGAGALYIRRLNPITAVSATPTTVYLRVYAWMSEVSVSVPTATRIVVDTESGDADERETGPVEAVSSAMVKVSNSLMSVPLIKPYAVASSYIFSGIGHLAAHLGWSAPVPLHEPSFVRNRGAYNAAQVIGYSSAKRLTLDPKQELTIDPSATASTEDDMFLQKIASRRSYLTTFTWNPASTAVLWKCKATPNLSSYYTVLTDNWAQPTAMNFAVTPFKYWRGDIVFRFEIVCSAYHRGKIAIIYEPNIDQDPLISTEYNTNKQCVTVIDIQETQTFDFCVNWASYRSWLSTSNPMTAASSANVNYGSTFSSTAWGREFCNGYIYVYPFTELQSPDSDPLEINVYVSCPNLRVNKLGTNLPSSREIITESGDITQPVTCLDLNPNTSKPDHISLRHFGEEPFTFRSLLKRYDKVENTITVTAPTAGSQVITIIKSNYPRPVMLYGTTNSVLKLFDYLKYAYMGVRGSLRYRHVIRYDGSIQDRKSITSVKLRNVETTDVGSVSFGSVTALNSLNANGGVMFPEQTSPVIEIEVPLYTNNKFLFSFADDLIGVNPGGEMRESWVKRHEVQEYVQTTGTLTAYINTYVSTGEDFTLMRFCGAPFYKKS